MGAHGGGAPRRARLPCTVGRHRSAYCVRHALLPERARAARGRGRPERPALCRYARRQQCSHVEYAGQPVLLLRERRQERAPRGDPAPRRSGSDETGQDPPAPRSGAGGGARSVLPAAPRPCALRVSVPEHRRCGSPPRSRAKRGATLELHPAPLRTLLCALQGDREAPRRARAVGDRPPRAPRGQARVEAPLGLVGRREQGEPAPLGKRRWDPPGRDVEAAAGRWRVYGAGRARRHRAPWRVSRERRKDARVARAARANGALRRAP